MVHPDVSGILNNIYKTQQNKIAESISNTEEFFKWLIESAWNQDVSAIEAVFDNETDTFNYKGDIYEATYVAEWIQCYQSESVIFHLENTSHFIIYVYVITALVLIGLFGNGLSYIVLQKHKIQNSTTCLLKALALADSSFLCSSFVDRPLYYITWFTEWFPNIRNVYPWLFKFSWPLYNFTQAIATWLVVVVTYDRYLAVCKPHDPTLRTTKRAHIASGVVILAAFILCSSRFFELEVTTRETVCGDTVWTDWAVHDDYHIAYNILAHNIFANVVPCIILIYLNVKLIQKMRFLQQRNREMTRGRRTEERVTLMLVAVAVVFTVCVVPERLIWCLFTFIPSLEGRDYVYPVGILLRVINSSVNFLIYCLFNKGFYETLNGMCRCSRCESETSGRNGIRQRNSNTTVTGNTVHIEMTSV